MVKSCCAINCTNRCNDDCRARNITFHLFPADESRRAAWIRAVRRIDPRTKKEWQPSTSSVLCSCHFDVSMFRFDRGYTLLKPDAVPTIFTFPNSQGRKPVPHRLSTVSKAAMLPISQEPEIPRSSGSACDPATEHSYAVMQSPRTLKRRCDVMEEQLQGAKRALYNAERREVRAKSTLATVLMELEKQNLLAAECRRLLSCFESLPLDLFIKESAAYTEEQRQFATTLHYHSPKAYEFCRKTLKLPSISTLRRWVCGIDYRPGFSEQVFTSLAEKVSGPNGWQYKTCCVMIDGMSIRKHIDWDSKLQKMMGFTDFGAGPIDNDSQDEATEALVIMAVGLTGHWKVPIGYFLITGISATIQAELIKTAFVKLHEAGIRGLALVMDGHATNQAMVSQLGGSLKHAEIKATFEHPSDCSQLVYIFFDACHMLKLLRNALEAVKEIILTGVGTARWCDIVNLHELQLGQELLLMYDSPYNQKYLLTYKLSQDHLELFFGCVRRMGGWNNNPSAKQFAYAYRALLSRASVTGSEVANVILQDQTDLLHINPEPESPKKEHFEPAAFTNGHDYCIFRNLSLFVSNVVEYISGWVVRKLSPKIACAECLSALFVPAGSACHTVSLLEIKNNGGLVRPSSGVVTVIKHAEKVLRDSLNIKQVTKQDQWGHAIEIKVLQSLPPVFQDLEQHFRDSQHGIDSHYTDLIRNLCRVYVKLRRFHVVNVTNQQLRGRSVRHVLTKAIIFKNQ